MFTENSHQTTTIFQTPVPLQFQGIIRTYYIAADEVMWNYAPTGINQITGKPLANDSTIALYTQNGTDRIGSTYLKCLYRGLH
ncbi:MAG: hypothetical protein KGI02_05425 [Thaumarchaeota archaeon]|nr:hypothetical protein [Nitrososphaerota archaeon]MDE1840901.1 hypothetical protein [Nitrososphaerota archaeon]MDE1877451.1 hypothetical protein [Nitrososphaerota archaeon]